VPAAKLFASGGGGGPIVDERSVPKQTWDPDAPAISAHVPLLVGTCRDETAWTIGERNPAVFTLDETAMRSRLLTTLRIPEADVNDLIGVYRKARPVASPSDIFFGITSDRSTRMNAITQAERKVAQGAAPAFMYNFACNTPMEGEKYRAFHTAELPLVLRLVRYPELEDQVSRQLAGAWASFARHGTPDQKNLHWPAYNTEERATMIFTRNDSHIERDPMREARLKFRSL